jgi:intraflagellar transport protein 88
MLPSSAATHGPAPPLQQRSQDSPEHAAKDMEKSVNKLLEESAFAAAAKNYPAGLDKAKVGGVERARGGSVEAREQRHRSWMQHLMRVLSLCLSLSLSVSLLCVQEAGKQERALCKHREKNGLTDQINFDLTYAVCFNLANCYAAAKMYTEALGAYALVVKNKQYPQAGRLRVNMGNIYYTQKKYPAAIKMYRMAMDQIGQLSREMRFKIMRNIGVSFVKLGQFQDAVHSFEAIMDQAPDAQTAFNLLVCFYALGEREKMRKAFLALVNVPEYAEQEKEDEEDAEAEILAAAQAKKNNQAKVPTSLVLDELRSERKGRRKVTHRYLHMAARLIAPVIEKDLAEGFDWVIEHLKAPRGGSQNQNSTTSVS